MLHNWATGRGSVLADEMGLGKTCQVIFRKIAFWAHCCRTRALRDAVSFFPRRTARCVLGATQTCNFTRIELGALASTILVRMESGGTYRKPPEVACLLEHVFSVLDGGARFLVVAPVSTLQHWVRPREHNSAGAASPSINLFEARGSLRHSIDVRRSTLEVPHRSSGCHTTLNRQLCPVGNLKFW